MKSTFKDTFEILALIAEAQAGSSRAENTLVKIYDSYVDYMVSKYSKKTLIKEDADLRSYIYMGLIEGIRRFDPSKNTRFIYFAHIWMKKNIFLGESKYRFIKVPINQKVTYETFLKEHQDIDKEIHYDLEDKLIKKYLMVENTKTRSFTDFTKLNKETHSYEFPQDFLYHNNLDNFKTEAKQDTIDILRQNIEKVLSEFSEKEIYILEHLFGLNDKEILNSNQIAKNLEVSKVNVTYTKTRVIRLLRHSSFSNKLFKNL